MSESRMWEYLNERMRQVWTAERITDRTRKGLPDVIWQHRRMDAAGFLELKYVARLTSTEWRKHWVQPEQAAFLCKWKRGGGRAAILLRVGQPDLWRLYPVSVDLPWLQQIVKASPTTELYRHEWNGFPDPDHLLTALRL